MAIFVDYDDSYVNIIMSTPSASTMQFFIISYYFARYRACRSIKPLHLGLAIFLAVGCQRVNFIYPLAFFVQLNDFYISLCEQMYFFSPIFQETKPRQRLLISPTLSHLYPNTVPRRTAPLIPSVSKSNTTRMPYTLQTEFA